MRTLLNRVGILAFIMATAYFVYHLQDKKTYCGTIKYKVEATRWGKHTAHADPIFVIKLEYPNINYEIHPTWADYLDRKIGDRVCYRLSVDKVEDTLDRVMLITMGLYALGITLVCSTLNWET